MAGARVPHTWVRFAKPAIAIMGVQMKDMQAKDRSLLFGRNGFEIPRAQWVESRIIALAEAGYLGGAD